MKDGRTCLSLATCLVDIPIRLTGVLDLLSSGEFLRVGEHEHDTIKAVLGCAPQSNYRTTHTRSGGAALLWAL